VQPLYGSSPRKLRTMLHQQGAIIKGNMSSNLLMPLRAVGHHQVHSLQPSNMEVVVDVHAAQTTTTEHSYLGIMTCSKRKLITSEKQKPASNIQEVVAAKHYISQQQLQNSHSPMHNILLVDVTGNTLTTTSTQLQPESMMMKP